MTTTAETPPAPEAVTDVSEAITDVSEAQTEVSEAVDEAQTEVSEAVDEALTATTGAELRSAADRRHRTRRGCGRSASSRTRSECSPSSECCASSNHVALG